MAAYVQLLITPQEFDIIEELLINSAESRATPLLLAKLAVERARIDARETEQASKLARQAAKRKPTKEERQAALIADGYVWVTYQGERSLWPPGQLPAGGFRDDGSEIKYTSN